MEKSLSLDEILAKILNREISVRQASRESGYSRDFIRAELKRKYANDKDKLELIELIMQENKEQSSTVEIDQELLEQTFFKVMDKEISLKEAQSILGDIDILTMKEKFAKLVGESKNSEIPAKYLESIQNKNNINFRVVAIRMMRLDQTQTDMAKELKLQPRTISREFEKFKYDKDKRLYYLLKDYGSMKARGKKMTSVEYIILDKILTDYEEHNKHLLELPKKSKEELAIERQEYLVSEENRLKLQGLTQEQIAKELKTSVSTLRRAKVAKRQRDIITKIKLEQDGEEK